MTDSSNPSRQRWLICGLAAIIFVTFARLCIYEFVYWDDVANISENEWMRQPWLEIVGHYLRHDEGGLFIPVTYAVWGALARLGMTTVPNAQGDLINPWFFHTFNVVIHVVITLLVFRLLRKLSGNVTASILGAAVFALHPVQVETVGWVSGSKDLLCWFFVALGLNIYLDLIERSRNQTLIRFWMQWRFWAVFALMITAFLSKPTAMVMSALLVVFDHFLHRTKLRLAIVRALPFFLISVAGVLVTKKVQVAVGVYEPDLPGKFLVAADALAHYAIKIVWPVDLAFDYGRMPDRVLIEWKSTTRIIWIIPALIGALSLACWKKYPMLTGAAAIFVICVAPLLGFVPFMFQAYSTVADHYMYFGMLGIAVGVTFGLSKLKDRQQWLFAPIVFALAFLSILQCAVWKDTQSLTTHCIEVNPRSFGNYNNLGLDQANRHEIEQAIGSFTRAIELNPHSLIAYRNRARTNAQNFGDYASAERDLEYVLNLVRTSQPPPSHKDLADALLELAGTKIRLRKLEAASKLIEEAESIHPGNDRLRDLQAELRDAIRISTPGDN